MELQPVLWWLSLFFLSDSSSAFFLPKVRTIVSVPTSPHVHSLVGWLVGRIFGLSVTISWLGGKLHFHVSNRGLLYITFTNNNLRELSVWPAYLRTWFWNFFAWNSASTLRLFLIQSKLLYLTSEQDVHSLLLQLDVELYVFWNISK